MGPTKNCSRYTGLLAAVAGALFGSQSLAEVSRGLPATDPQTKPAEKVVSVQFDNAPWKKVIEWYQDLTGLEFHSSYAPPTGSFSYYGKRKLTIPEITDLLNEALQVKKYVLLRREATFMLLPADEPVPLELVPRIKLEELKNHGKSEFVSIVYELKHLNAKETAPEVMKMMGPSGRVVPLLRPNLLLMQEKVRTLEMILHVLEQGARSAQGVTEFIPLATLDAKVVADTLKAMYLGGDLKTGGAPYIEGDQLRNAIMVKGTAEQVADVKASIKAIGDNPGALAGQSMRIIAIDRGSAATLAEALQTLLPRLGRPVTVILPGRDLNVAPRDRTPP